MPCYLVVDKLEVQAADLDRRVDQVDLVQGIDFFLFHKFTEDVDKLTLLFLTHCCSDEEIITTKRIL